jgi:hypothetical protein
MLILRNDEDGEEFTLPPPHEGVQISLPLFSANLWAENWVDVSHFQGRPCFVKESVFIPQYAETKGCQVWIVDRGIVIGRCEVDLGVPGVVVVREKGSLRVDLGGGGIVEDENWESMIRGLRERIRETLRLGCQHMDPSANGFEFVTRWCP